MAETQNVILQPVSSEGKELVPLDFLALQKTSEEKKKPRSVGFYELDVLNAPKESKEPEVNNGVQSEITEDGVKKDPQDKGSVDSAQDGQPQEHKDPAANYFDQSLPTSRKLSVNPSCPCKECVENYMNLCHNCKDPDRVCEEKRDWAAEPKQKDEADETEQKDETDEAAEPERKNEAGEPEKKDWASDVERKDKAIPYADGTPTDSERSRSGSETSRRTNSSEDDFVGTKHEDAQVTLPYPDKKQSPKCIAKLSNAGLYDPSEDPKGKSGDEDNVSQVVINTAFFVEHPPLEDHMKTVRMDLSEKVDVEKGEAESEPLLRLTRRPTETEPVHPGCCHCHSACLKIVGSFVLSMVIFPAFLFAAFAWLPFDAPVIPDVPTRLVYTLRCSAFASFPIVLGVIVHGISRLCASSYDPFKPREREVTIHRQFVKQSTFLFVLFFFNLSVLATYLPQTQLKFIPLLTCLFSLSQLTYWLSFAVGRSFRGFGYGLTFLPLLGMMICNLYFMFVVEPEKMVFLGNRVVPQH
ncbi:transmembrane protein 79 [Dendropsophus ebraccatus]|uniref:transmembrane protein 79 n=1 Tax=Dendropsophus ebraccatus TaxID=150705 RepID=UPI003831C98C